ncbi:MAG TPA: amino acid adenylation domain-containing protein, partial [Ruminiclostridium sp.]|nr:amino acid adenylation domain-containing protein [Ruminiclostridium sp.]
MELVTAKIWAKVLGYNSIGINDDYYKLGGDSIQGLKIVNSINETLNTSLDVPLLLNNPTIEKFARALSKRGISDYKPIETAPEYKYYPLSSAQRRLFLVNQIEGPNIKYNMPNAVILEGLLDKERFSRAFEALMERHEVLRTSFDFIDGEPVQRVNTNIQYKIKYLEAEEKLIEEIFYNFVKPFDLEEAPLIRMALVKVSEMRHYLVFDIHHIIFDGGSMGIIVKELLQLYDNEMLPSLKIQYKDYSHWHNQRIQTGELKEQEEYWLNTFRGEIPVTRIPADFAFNSKRNFRADSLWFYIGKAETDALKKLASDSDATMYMTLLAVFSILVSSYTGQEDIVIGSPIAGRNHPDLEPLIGIFINVLAMRISIDSGSTFGKLLAKVKDIALNAYGNQEYPFEELIEKLSIKRDTNSNPLFNIMFALHSNLKNDHYHSKELDIIESKYEVDTAAYDMTLDAVETEEGITFNLVYANELYMEETMQRLVGHFCNIVSEVTANPDIFLSDIHMLSKEEKEQILCRFNPEVVTPLKTGTVTQLLARSMSENSQRVAVLCNGETLSYRQLEERSDKLAGILRARGISRNSIAGVLLPRSTDMFVAILGVLKAGGAYLPIDPEYPKNRIAYMVEDSHTKVIISNSETASDILPEGTVLYMEELEQYKENNFRLEDVNEPGDLAYVIYTSGSTGKPKGVMIEHEALCNFIMGITEKIPFETEKTILALTTVSFDIFGLETILPLTRGLKIVMANEKEQKDAGLLSRLIIEHKIDMVQATPSRARIILEDERSKEIFGQIGTLMIGGEAFPDNLLVDLKKVYKGKLYNMYGPTETTIWSTVKDLTNAERVNIGQPIQNTFIYILDSNLNLKPVGCAGDMYIGGTGLARGYYGRKELTDERFVPNPFMKGQRIYKTGDTARWFPNGDIEFIGRTDNQVKINGFRIELGEIEEVLKQYGGVKEAVVRKWETEAGSYLCAYIISDVKIDLAEIKGHISGRLPYYMLPQCFMQIDSLTYTPNDKIDRNALPKPQYSTLLANNYREAESEIEKEIVEIWQGILGLERIGVDDNFFDLGGNSIMLVKMHRQLEKKYPGTVDVTDIFGYATVSKISRLISEQTAVKKEVALKPVQLPDEYFDFKYSLNRTSVIKYMVKDELYRAISLGAEKLNSTAVNLLLALYFFTISSISQSTLINISTALGGTKAILPLSLVPIRKIEGMEDVKALQESILADMKKQEPISTNEIIQSQIVKKDNEILTLFSDGKLSTSLSGIYDIIVEVRETGSSMELALEYNERLLSKEKVKMLLSGYVNLIQSLGKL